MFCLFVINHIHILLYMDLFYVFDSLVSISVLDRKKQILKRTCEIKLFKIVNRFKPQTYELA